MDSPWHDGVDEARILIASSSDSCATNGDGVGRFLQLRHPKTGDSKCYLLVNGGLQELNWYKQSYGSWFIGDYICEDGSLYAATPVDPVFILLPLFDDARMKNGDDLGKFRQIDEIIYLQDYPGYHHLATIAEKSMEVVCDCKEIGSMKFFRLNDSKVLAWMYCKVQQLKQSLLKLDNNYAARSQKDTCTVCGIKQFISLLKFNIVTACYFILLAFLVLKVLVRTDLELCYTAFLFRLPTVI